MPETIIWVNNVTGDLTYTRGGNGYGTEAQPVRDIRGAQEILDAMDPSVNKNVIVRVVNAGQPYTHGAGGYPATPHNIDVTGWRNCVGTSYEDFGFIIEGWPANDWPIIDTIGETPPVIISIPGNNDYTIIRQFIYKNETEATNPWAFVFQNTEGHVRIECIDCGTETFYANGLFDTQGTLSSLDLEMRCIFYRYWRSTAPVVSLNSVWRWNADLGSLHFHHNIVDGRSQNNRNFRGTQAIWSDYVGQDYLFEHNTIMNFTYDGSYSRGMVFAGWGRHGTPATGTLTTIRNNIFVNCHAMYGGTPGLYGGGDQNIHVAYNNCYYEITQACGWECGAWEITYQYPGDNAVLADPDFDTVNEYKWLYGLTLPAGYYPNLSDLKTASSEGGMVGALVPWWEIERADRSDCVFIGCGYRTVYGTYPEGMRAELSRKTGATHITVVCYDLEGVAGGPEQVTCRVSSIRPVVQEVILDMGAIKASDIHIVFDDTEGYLDPYKPGSLLYGQPWKHCLIQIGSWMRGTEHVLVHATMLLESVECDDGVSTTWRCIDKFGLMLRRHIRANTVLEEDIENTEDGELTGVTVFARHCPIGQWTVRFTSSSTFEVYSEQLGFEGEGTTGATFTAESGAIQIPTGNWSGTFNNEDEFRFITSLVVRRTGAFEALRLILSSDSDGGYYDLDEDDFDTDSWSAAVAETAWWLIDVVQKDPISAAEMTRRIMKHVVGGVYVHANGTLAAYTISPKLKTPDLRVICGRKDLMHVKTRNTEVQDVAVGRYDQDVSGELLLSRRYPASDVTGYEYYEKDGKEAYEFDLEYFIWEDGARVGALLEYINEVRLTMREEWETKTTLEGLRLGVTETAWIDPQRPDRDVCTLIRKVSKDLAKNEVTVWSLEAEGDLVQCRSAAHCGFCFCDVGHRCDVCWVCW